MENTYRSFQHQIPLRVKIRRFFCIDQPLAVDRANNEAGGYSVCFYIKEGDLIPITGQIFRLKGSPENAAPTQKQDSKLANLSNGSEERQSSAIAPAEEQSFRKIMLVLVGRILGNPQPDLIVLARRTDNHPSALTYVNQRKNLDSRVFFNSVTKNEAGILSAKIDWQAGPYSESNHADLMEKSSNRQSTQLTVRKGSEFDVPYLGRLRVESVLPKEFDREAWLVMSRVRSE